MFQGLRHTLHPAEVWLLNSVLEGLQGTGVEIGSLDGFSALTILKASSLNLICIDPFIPDSMDAQTQGNADNFYANLDGLEDRMSLIIDYSYEVIKFWTKDIDFLFIDGDHRHEFVLKDYIEWVPFLKSGGLLAMHDSRISRGVPKYWPGPSEVADQYVFGQPDYWEIVGEAQTLTIARKK